MRSPANKEFIDITQTVLNKHAPIKEKHLRNNESVFMTNNFQNVMITRSRLFKWHTIVGKKRLNQVFLLNKKNCVRITLKNPKNIFYNDLDIKRGLEINFFGEL